MGEGEAVERLGGGEPVNVEHRWLLRLCRGEGGLSRDRRVAALVVFGLVLSWGVGNVLFRAAPSVGAALWFAPLAVFGVWVVMVVLSCVAFCREAVLSYERARVSFDEGYSVASFRRRWGAGERPGWALRFRGRVEPRPAWADRVVAVTVFGGGFVVFFALGGVLLAAASLGGLTGVIAGAVSWVPWLVVGWFAVEFLLRWRALSLAGWLMPGYVYGVRMEAGLCRRCGFDLSGDPSASVCARCGCEVHPGTNFAGPAEAVVVAGVLDARAYSWADRVVLRAMAGRLVESSPGTMKMMLAVTAMGAVPLLVVAAVLWWGSALSGWWVWLALGLLPVFMTVVVIGAALVPRVYWHRVSLGCCGRCGYDLSGDAGAEVCPECGEAVHPEMPRLGGGGGGDSGVDEPAG